MIFSSWALKSSEVAVRFTTHRMDPPNLSLIEPVVVHVRLLVEMAPLSFLKCDHTKARMVCPLWCPPKARCDLLTGRRLRPGHFNDRQCSLLHLPALDDVVFNTGAAVSAKPFLSARLKWLRQKTLREKPSRGSVLTYASTKRHKQPQTQSHSQRPHQKKPSQHQTVSLCHCTRSQLKK